MKQTFKQIVTGLAIFLSTNSYAQLPDGSTAPNFTLTDINGTSHNLYDYLNDGKTVYIDFFACHCPYCWDYHSTHALSDLYDSYGPGTANNDVFVFAIELDAGNGTNEFYGISGITQGNWVAGTNYPQINPEGADRASIISNFAVNYYPLIYAICPDGTITEIGRKTTNLLYAHTNSCNTTLGIDESEPTFSVSQNTNAITILSPADLTGKNANLVISDIQGKKIESQNFSGNSGTIGVEKLVKGIYFIQIVQQEQILFSQKIQL